MNTSAINRAGTIDERGLLNSMHAHGFTPEQCFSEIISNAVDAGATSIVVMVRDDTVEFIDDGQGMDHPGLERMHSVYNEGHGNDTSHGRSGIGGKIAAKLLGHDHPVSILTCNGSGYHKADVPWDKIKEQGKWIDMVTIVEMSDIDKSYYKDIMDIHLDGSVSGTIISLKKNASLMRLINSQFKGGAHDSPMQCMPYIFGPCPINISLNDNDGLYSLPKINPMAEDIEFYAEKEVVCRVYKKHTGEHDVVMFDPDDENKEKWFKKSALRTGTKLTGYNPEGGRSNQFADFTVKVRAPHDRVYFDMEAEFKKEATASGPFSGARSLPDYEMIHFNETDERPKPSETFCEDLSKPVLIRNGLNVGPVNLTTIKFTSGRATAKTSLKNQRMRTHIITSPLSGHRNILDEFFSVQLNKIQRNNLSDKGLVRILECIIERTSEEAWTLIIARNDSLPEEEADEEEADEEEADEEEADEEEADEEEIPGPLSPKPPTHEDPDDMANPRIQCVTVIEVLRDTINALVERDESGYHYANCGKELLDMIIALKVAQTS